MARKRVNVEYPLATKSTSIAWKMIGTAAGLQKWLANYVTEKDDNEWSFQWGEAWTERDIKISRIVEREKFHLIRLRWEDSEDGEYWEMRIEPSALTGKLNLLITDFADDEDVDYLRDLWEKNLVRLHRISGL